MKWQKPSSRFAPYALRCSVPLDRHLLLLQQEKPYKVDILTNYEKKTLTKNLAGEPEEYQLLLSVEFTVLKDNSQIKLKLNEKFVMNNFSDDFEERNYETNIKKSMVNLIYNKFLKQIRNLK